MVASNKPEVWLPCFGLWEKTREDNLPSPAATRLGLWIEGGMANVRFFCVLFRDADGNGVDPDEEEWDHYTFHSRQGDPAHWDDVIEPPDYWADCRFLIAGGE